MYLTNDRLPSADVFETFREICLKIYHADPAKLFSAAGLAWQAALKKTEKKVRIIN